MTEPFDLVSQMNLAAFEFTDRQVVSQFMNQNFTDLVLEPLNISNMVWFCHNIPKIHGRD